MNLIAFSGPQNCVNTQYAALSGAMKGVEKLLSNLKTSKAVGPDIIPNIVLKTCASELSVGLGSILKYSLDTGTLPMDWRGANISPVFKKGDRHQAENYRPVSLTSISCKLLEHILCSHILKHFEQYNVLTRVLHQVECLEVLGTQL